MKRRTSSLANTNYELDRILGLNTRFSIEDLLEFASGGCPVDASCKDCPVEKCMDSAQWAIEHLLRLGIKYEGRK